MNRGKSFGLLSTGVKLVRNERDGMRTIPRCVTASEVDGREEGGKRVVGMEGGGEGGGVVSCRGGGRNASDDGHRRSPTGAGKWCRENDEG